MPDRPVTARIRPWMVEQVKRLAGGMRAALRRHPWLRAALRPVLPALRRVTTALPPISYADWIAAHDTRDEAARARIRTEIEAWDTSPLISVVMRARDATAADLEAAVASVRAQLYPHWELCIIDGASPAAGFAAAEPRIRCMSGGAGTGNAAIALTRGAWVLPMDPRHRLAETALYRIAAEERRHSGVAVIYSDEDRIDAAGHRSAPWFKPDFDPDLFLARDMPGQFVAYRRDLLDRIGGYREDFGDAAGYDLVLRATMAAGAGAVRHVPAVLCHVHGHDGAVLDSEAARRAVADALAGSAARVVANPLSPGCRRILYPLPDPPPLVSVIIPTRDRGELLGACMDGLLHGTDYPRIEVLIVDNESTDPATLALLARLAEDSRVRVLPVPGAFNYSRLNNLAVAQARGEVLLLLNNDIEVIEPNWLREMVSHALRPEIGAVGAKLLYPDDTVQHAGVVLGFGWPEGVGGHMFLQARRDDPGPFDMLAVARSASAVTAACLAVRRSLYDEVGGLDEEGLKVAFNDVDFCLRLRERGYRNLWTPFALLYHKESASRGSDATGEKAERLRREVAVMRARWGAALDDDPYWNPNLSLRTGWPDLAEPPRLR